MILIFCALYPEAIGLIRALGLKREQDNAYQVFANDDIALTLTGCGKINASGAVSHMLTRYPDRPFVINIGSCCGQNPGELFHIADIFDYNAERHFYPDMILDIPAAKARLVTVDKPVGTYSNCQAPEESLPVVHDMEGSGIFQSSQKYIGPDRILLLKAVSDSGSDGNISADLLTNTINMHLDKLLYIIGTVNDYMDRIYPVRPVLDKALFEYMDKLHCSEYMRNDFRVLWDYAASRGIDLTEKIDDYLPVPDRRSGKEVLREIREYLTM